MDRQCGRGRCSRRVSSEQSPDPKDAGVGYSRPAVSFQVSLPGRLDKSHPPLARRAKGEGAYHSPVSHTLAPTQRQSRFPATAAPPKVAWTDTPEVHLERVLDVFPSHQYTTPCCHKCQGHFSSRAYNKCDPGVAHLSGDLRYLAAALIAPARTRRAFRGHFLNDSYFFQPPNHEEPGRETLVEPHCAWHRAIIAVQLAPSKTPQFVV
jgi:hypothetical protein